ncbi:MAG: zf-HC2 domain-containing protein [Bacteroidales bacterium]|jgi:TolA-binding protein
MNDRLNNIFSDTDCLSPEILSAYADGKLNADERYRVERHLIDCELCSDALEGLSLLKNKTKLPKLFTGINSTIDKRVNKKEARVFRFDFRMRLAVAALIIVVLGFTFLFKFIFQEQKKEMVAQRMLKEPDITKAEKKLLEKNIDSTSYEEHEPRINNDDKPSQNITIKAAEKNPDEQVVNDITTIIPKAEVSNEPIGGDQQKDITGYYRSKGKETDSSQGLLAKTDEDKYHYNNISSAQDYKNASGENLQKTVADSVSVSTSFATETKTTSQSPVISNSSNAEQNVSYAYNKEQDKREEKKAKLNEKAGKKTETVPPASVSTSPIITDNLGGAEDKRYSEAIQKYQDKDYTGSKDMLESYLKDEPADFNALYYCGVSYYYLYKYDNAITYLEKAIKFKSNSNLETAQWYLALSYIGKNENNKADTLLNEIVKAKGSYKNQAERKLLELK